MKNLADILKNEQEQHTISSLAKSLGFKNDNIKLFFERSKKVDALNLVVDVDYAADGDANNAYLLEAKLIEALKVGVVIVLGKISDRANKLAVENSSFALKNNEVEISQFLNRSLEDIIFRDPLINQSNLEHDLKTADRVMELIEKKNRPLSSSSTFFSLQATQSSSLTTDKIYETETRQSMAVKETGHTN